MQQHSGDWSSFRCCFNLYHCRCCRHFTCYPSFVNRNEDDSFRFMQIHTSLDNNNQLVMAVSEIRGDWYSLQSLLNCLQTGGGLWSDERLLNVCLCHFRRLHRVSWFICCLDLGFTRFKMVRRDLTIRQHICFPPMIREAGVELEIWRFVSCR